MRNLKMILLGCAISGLSYGVEIQTEDPCDEFKNTICTREYDPHHCDANSLGGSFIAGFTGSNRCSAIASTKFQMCKERNLMPDDYTIQCFADQ